MAEVVLRLLREEDLDRGFLEALAQLSEVGLSAAEARQTLQLRELRGVLTFVAVEGERVLGTASLLVEPKFIHRGASVGHVEDVAVLPEARGRGVGRALVLHTVEESRRRGCYKVILNCRADLVPFYEASGFRVQDTGMRRDLPGAG